MFIPDELYQKIVGVMPIPCVDLLITDPHNKILLVKRNNEPAKGEWWFPGGRVHFGELRKDAAIRKLKEECGLVQGDIEEIGTFDVLLPIEGSNNISHGITTVYHISSVESFPVTLDDQSNEFVWNRPKEWNNHDLHQFVRLVINKHLVADNRLG